jgi:hypothetical protein
VRAAAIAPQAEGGRARELWVKAPCHYSLMAKRIGDSKRSIGFKNFFTGLGRKWQRKFN